MNTGPDASSSPAQPACPSSWTDEAVVELLRTHTYDQTREITGWSRGRIYFAACRQNGRKTEARIAMRKAERAALQREFLAEAMGQTARMDVLDFLAGLPAGSVDLFVTSPPYNLNKGYESGDAVDSMRFAYFYGWLVMCVAEMARILKPGGSLCLNVGQTLDGAGGLYPMDVLLFENLRRAGLTYQSRIIWGFGHGLTPKRRLAERYETVLVFSRGEQQVFNANAARMPQKEPGKRAFKGPRRGHLSGHWAGAAPSNLWLIPQIGANHGEKTDHPCQFPEALVRRLVLLYSNAGALVCDPFSGSGSTHVTCVKTGRAFVGADLFYETTRATRLAKAFPDLVTALPGVSDESVAVWQAEARRIDVGVSAAVTLQEELNLFEEACV